MSNAYLNLFEAALESAAKGDHEVAVNFDESFDLHIVVEGESWDEKVDLRAARFIEDFQHALDRLHYEIFSYDVALSDRELVKVRVTKGSSDFVVETGKLLRKMVGNMSPNQKTLLIAIAILAVAGGYVTDKYIGYKKAINEKVQDEATKVKLIEALDRAHSHHEDFEKPMRSLVQAMKPEDTIQLPFSNEKIDKEAAKKEYPRRPRTASKTDFIDAKFLVKDISYDEPITATLELNDITFRAGILLPAVQMAEFYDQLKALHLTAGADIELDLQITARYSASGSGIREATIVGVGQPRPATVKLSDIVAH